MSAQPAELPGATSKHAAARGQMVFTGMDRVLFGTPAAEAVASEAARLDASRVFILAGGTLARETNAVRRVIDALGSRFAGLHDTMPAHSPREAVVACANAARAAGCDLLITIGGGSVTDGGKAVTLARRDVMVRYNQVTHREEQMTILGPCCAPRDCGRH